jgi:hypothetical protein
MMSNTSQTPGTSVPQDETEGVRTIIHQMSGNLETLSVYLDRMAADDADHFPSEQTLHDLKEQSSKISAMGPTSVRTTSTARQ